VYYLSNAKAENVVVDPKIRSLGYQVKDARKLQFWVVIETLDKKSLGGKTM
jgi:hypothetical protein